MLLFSTIPLKIGFNTYPYGYKMGATNSASTHLGLPYLYFGYLPNATTSASYTRGFLVNGNTRVTFNVASLGDHYNYMALYTGFNAYQYSNLATTDSAFITTLFSSTRNYLTGRVMPEDFFMYFEIWFDNLPPAAAMTSGPALNRLCVHTVAMGFR